MALQGTSDGLLRWLVGGLVGGAIVLGLLVAAYAIGYHRGSEKGVPAAVRQPQPPPSTPTGTTPATPTTPSSGALASRGKQLFIADGCSSCHSLTGSAGVGPALDGLVGSRVALADGTTVTADRAYLERSITDADAQIVKSFRAGVMPAAIASFDLKSKPGDVAALVAFIASHR